jgi:LTXXQ motif family protein
MRPWTLPILGAVALSLAVPSNVSAGPRFGPGTVLGAVAGAMFGGFRHSVKYKRRHATHASAGSRHLSGGERQRAANALRGLGGAAMTNATPEPSASSERRAAIFWPDAADDLADYVLFANGSGGFWTHGYDTIVSAAFAPAEVEDQRTLRGRPRATRLSDAAPTEIPLASGNLCGATFASADANALIERIERAVAPSASQRSALEQLQRALAEAIERIKASCPTAMSATVADRLKTIQDRIWAMRDALLTIRVPFEAFYNSLSDEQRQRLQHEDPEPAELAASATEGRGRSAAEGRASMCAEPGAGTADWIMRAIARATPPREQRASLEAMRLRSAAMSQLVAGSCPSDATLDPMGRFAAATDRLHVMLFAVMSMSPMLQHLYDSLDDKQKAGLSRGLHQVRR